MAHRSQAEHTQAYLTTPITREEAKQAHDAADRLIAARREAIRRATDDMTRMGIAPDMTPTPPAAQ